MIPKKPAPHLMRGGYRFSEKDHAPRNNVGAKETRPMTELDVFEAIHTARALRRLKPNPIPEDLITRILDAAIRAPSAGAAPQTWGDLSQGLGHRERVLRCARTARASLRGAVSPAHDVG
jgi:hypothetical protein